MIETGCQGGGYIFHKPSWRIGRTGFRSAFFWRGAVFKRARRASSSFTGARLSREFFLRLRLPALFKSSLPSIQSDVPV